MGSRYTLVDRVPVLEPDLMGWAQWMETADRRVALSEVGECEISTVFLGLDHNFTGRGRPVLFETMVFKLRSREDLDSRRYCTWNEAASGHQDFVVKAKAGEYESILASIRGTVH